MQVGLPTDSPERSEPVRIGMVGSGFMAREHSAAYRLLPLILGDAVPPFELVRIAGGRRVHEVGPRYGWRQTADDWRAVTEAHDIDVVDIVTPNDTYAGVVRRRGPVILPAGPLMVTRTR